MALPPLNPKNEEIRNENFFLNLGYDFFAALILLIIRDNCLS